jgi:hypothetical protein
MERNRPSLDQKRDFEPLDTLRLSALSPVHAPFHLINAALNIQGSDYANRRGRDLTDNPDERALPQATSGPRVAMTIGKE